MKTGGEFLNVDSTSIAADGSKLEPEERRAVEITESSVDATNADHPVRPGDEPAVSQMRGLIQIESTAGDVAQSTATRCELCQHWRHADWEKHLADIAETKEGARMLDALRGELLGRSDLASITDDDFIAINIAIRREFGICAAFTESTKMVTLTPYYGGCGENDVRFKMRDREAQAIASAGYDKILRLAQGKGE